MIGADWTCRGWDGGWKAGGRCNAMRCDAMRWIEQSIPVPWQRCARVCAQLQRGVLDGITTDETRRRNAGRAEMGLGYCVL